VTDFRARSLSVLDRVYEFIGGTRGVSQFELGGSIQPVHDLSREAELGSRGEREAGFLMLTQTFAHVGATVIFETTDVYNSFDLLRAVVDFDSRGSRRHRLWLLDIFGSSDLAAFTQLSTGATIPVLTGAGGFQTLYLADWNQTRTAPVSGGPRPLVHSDAGDLQPRRLPALWQPGTIWNTRSSSSGNDTIRVSTLWWAGPLGTTPPGMR